MSAAWGVAPGGSLLRMAVCVPYGGLKTWTALANPNATQLLLFLVTGESHRMPTEKTCSVFSVCSSGTDCILFR